jgi:hypothetical protein
MEGEAQIIVSVTINYINSYGMKIGTLCAKSRAGLTFAVFVNP